jgi:hypothetical protein
MARLFFLMFCLVLGSQCSKNIPTSQVVENNIIVRDTTFETFALKNILYTKHLDSCLIYSDYNEKNPSEFSRRVVYRQTKDYVITKISGYITVKTCFHSDGTAIQAFLISSTLPERYTERFLRGAMNYRVEVKNETTDTCPDCGLFTFTVSG